MNNNPHPESTAADPARDAFDQFDQQHGPQHPSSEELDAMCETDA